MDRVLRCWGWQVEGWCAPCMYLEKSHVLDMVHVVQAFVVRSPRRAKAVCSAAVELPIHIATLSYAGLHKSSA